MIKKVELLAPAGSFEALEAAVQNGCDAVYLGGTMFGARAFANNFEDEEIDKAVRYAHRYGVRVFVTVNTLVKEEEMTPCIAYIQRLQQMDVDALIIQDIGLFTYVHQCFPDFELHASTQMHIHNPQGIQMLQELGAARVVVPRETTIEEITQYAKLGVDIEVFVQGALCVSYSGQCLMSALTLDRSGNRGACAQSCRMQYELERTKGTRKEIIQTKGKYVLSPKDLNTLAYVPDLIEAGVASFKIEGRMKRPEYVALMVASYRKAIDAYFDNKKFHVDQHLQEEMEKIFNRGFSAGHLFHDMGSRLMNVVRPNHMGIAIGTIIGFHHDKVTIQLHHDLRQGDGIRVLTSRSDEGFTLNRLYQKGLLVSHAKAGDEIEIDKTFYVEKGSVVVKTSDIQQLKQLQESYRGIKRRIAIHASYQMRVNAPATLELWDQEGGYVHCETSVLCELAHTNPMSEVRIQTQLQKSKDTPFELSDIAYDMDGNSVIAIKEINQLRRNALEEMGKLRETRNGQRRVCAYETPTNISSQQVQKQIIVVHTKPQYEACKEAGVRHIYVDDDRIYEEIKQDPCVCKRTSRVMKQCYPSHHALIQELGGVYDRQSVVCDTSCNVTNHHSAAFLFSRNASGVCFSLESTLEECKAIQQHYFEEYGQYGNFIYPIYEREELMLSQYCAINASISDNDKKNCTLCKQADYALVDLKQHRYPLQTDIDCRMHILQEHPRNHLHLLEEAKQSHITSFACVFTNESKAECMQIVRQFCKETGI